MASAQEGTETRTVTGIERGTGGHTKCGTMMTLALGARRMKEREKEIERGTMTEAIGQIGTATVTVIVTGKGTESGIEIGKGIGIGIEIEIEIEKEKGIGIGIELEIETGTGKGSIAGAVGLLSSEAGNAEEKTNLAAPAPETENMTETTAGPALAHSPILAAPTPTPAQHLEADTAPVRSPHPPRPQWILLVMITTLLQQKRRWRA